jgi:hypothetical protein
MNTNSMCAGEDTLASFVFEKKGQLPIDRYLVSVTPFYQPLRVIEAPTRKNIPLVM